ncbi:MAG: hypothetical protein EBY29_02395 [Planctomycetes bacterium]|nr:hypothetical protein [Planctomycetota bacterium]
MDGDLSVDYLGDGYYALFRDNGDRRIIECVAPRVTDIFRTVARRFGHDHPVEMSYTAHLIFKLEAGIDFATELGDQLEDQLGDPAEADVEGDDFGMFDSKEY